LQADDKVLPQQVEDNDINFSSLITEDIEEEENDPPFHYLAGLTPPIPLQEKGDEAAEKKYKSVIGIFTSVPVLKKHIKEKGKRIILKFKQKV
jgi:hypothetical protein